MHINYVYIVNVNTQNCIVNRIRKHTIVYCAAKLYPVIIHNCALYGNCVQCATFRDEWTIYVHLHGYVMHITPSPIIYIDILLLQCGCTQNDR